MKHLQAYQAEMKRSNSRATGCFSSLDSDTRKKHQKIREIDKKILLEQLEAIKAVHVSSSLPTCLPQSACPYLIDTDRIIKDSEMNKYILALQEAALARGIDIDPILAAVPVPVSVSCLASSTPTIAAPPVPVETAPSYDQRRSDSSARKRRRLQDQYGLEN